MSGSTARIAVVIGGGPIAPVPEEFALRLDAVIAADSGWDVARAAGIRPTHLVGDMDSISALGLADARGLRGDTAVPVRGHPRAKDATDTELALAWAIELGADEIVLFGPSTTDRLDHLLGAITLLGAPPLAHCSSVRARLGETDVVVVHPSRTTVIELRAGQVLSLLALHGACTGVELLGARWELGDATILPGSTLGISNEATGGALRVGCAAGVLTVIIPPLEVSHP